MKTLHAIWMVECFHRETGETIPAHAEAWSYETPGAQYGAYVGDLDGWTEADCEAFANAGF